MKFELDIICRSLYKVESENNRKNVGLDLLSTL